MSIYCLKISAICILHVAICICIAIESILPLTHKGDTLTK
jgi:hypothetical protein